MWPAASGGDLPAECPCGELADTIRFQQPELRVDVRKPEVELVTKPSHAGVELREHFRFRTTAGKKIGDGLSHFIEAGGRNPDAVVVDLEP